MDDIHLIIVIITVLVVLYADEQAFMWMFGKRQILNRTTLEVLHVLTGLGLSLIILTGGLMFLDRSAYLLSNTFFLIKMTFVFALVVNSFVISSLGHIATTRPYQELTTKERRRLMISGGVSVICWTGAIICGLSL